MQWIVTVRKNIEKFHDWVCNASWVEQFPLQAKLTESFLADLYQTNKISILYIYIYILYCNEGNFPKWERNSCTIHGLGEIRRSESSGTTTKHSRGKLIPNRRQVRLARPRYRLETQVTLNPWDAIHIPGENTRGRGMAYRTALDSRWTRCKQGWPRGSVEADTKGVLANAKLNSGSLAFQLWNKIICGRAGFAIVGDQRTRGTRRVRCWNRYPRTRCNYHKLAATW